MANDLTIQGEVVVSSEKAEAAFDRVGDKADRMASGVAKSANEAGKAVDGIGAGAEKGAERFTRAEARMRDAIKKSTQELQTFGKTASEKMEFNIQAKGLDASKFAPYITELKKAEEATRAASGTISNMGMSAAATANAMRMVPAQFTDIVVSLQSGQKPLTVLMQQGGQLKDMFGGVGNAAKALGGYVMGLINPFTLAAGAAAVLAVAYNQGSKEADAYRMALITTGNAAGATTGQLKAYAQEISSVVGTQGKAAESLAAMAGTGKLGSDVLREAAQAAVQYERATGQAVGKTAEQFASLAKEPLQAVLKLNDGTNFLTESVYKQIKSLEEQGKTAEATAAAQRAYADALSGRSGEIVRNLGTIETAWTRIKDAAKGGWDAILNIGREKTNQDKLADVNKQLEDLRRRADAGFGETGGGAATGRPGGSARVQAQIAALEAQKAALFGVISAEKARAEETEKGNAKLQARAEWDKEGLKYLSKQEQMTRELTKARNEAAAAGASEEELQKRLAGIREKYKEKTSTAGDSELANLIARTTAAKLYYNQLLTIGVGASKLNEGEQKSLEIGEKIARTTDARTLSVLRQQQAQADALGVQLRTNAGLEESLKSHQAAIDATYREAEAIGLRAKEQDAANATFGKGKTAIEQMTLAELQKQMAEAQSSDNFDPKYIAGLELKIAAQKRWVAALQTTDYKTINAQADELLRNAQELAVLYADEQKLAGLTSLERSKIVALRQVELKYAKELAAIDKMPDGDDEQKALKAEARAKVERAKRIEGEAAVSKAIQDDWQRTTDEINRSLTDALMRGFESGKSFAENFRDTLKNMFNTLVLRPIISAVMNPVSGVINGFVQTGLNAMGIGGGSSLLGLASNASSLYGLGSSAMSLLGIGGSAGSLYALGTGATGLGLTAGAGGLGLTAGGGLGLTAGSGLGMSGAGVGAGAAGGFGSMLSAIPGWGWALGGLALLAGSGLFKDNSGTPHWGAGATYDNGTLRGGKDIYDNAHFSMGIQDEYSGKVQPFVDSVVKGVGSTLDTISRAFGGKGGYQVSTAYADDSSKDPSFGSFRISKDGKSIVDWNDTRADKWAPRNFADGEEGQKLYLAEIAKDTRKVLLDMDLPSWAKTMLDAIGETASMDDLSKVVQQIGEIQTLFTRLGDTLVGFAGMTDKAFEALLNASGSAQALGQNADTFYQNFYSDSERKAIAKRQLSGKLHDLGVDINLDDPDARAKYRKLIEDQLAQSNIEEANRSAVKNNITMAITAGGLDGLKGQDIGSIVRGALGPDTAVSDVDIGKLKEGLASLDTAGMSADKLKDSVGKLLEPIVGTGKSAAETAAALLGLSGAFSDVTVSADDAAAAAKRKADEEERARKEALDKAYGNLQNSVGLERDRLTQQRDALTEQRGLAQESLSLITGVFDLVRSNAKELFGQVDEIAAMQAAQGMVFIEQALSAARSTGYLPDSKQLGEAISSARGGLDMKNYASGTQLDYDRLVLANQLKSLEEISGKQKTAQEQQIELLDSQLKGIDKQNKYLDDLLRETKKQIDIATGVLDAELSVADAAKAIYDLLKPGGKDGASGVGKTGASGGAVFGGTDPGRTDFGGPAEPTKYRQRMSGGTAGVEWYDNIYDPSAIDHLDKLSDIYHSFDGTGDVEGLLKAVKAAGGSMDDIAVLGGYFPQDVAKAGAKVGIAPFATGGAFTNGIVQRPTAFNMGQMGEAGPEGILPLANVGGRLGVYAAGGGDADRLEKLVAALSERLEAVTAELEEIRDNTGRFADQFGNWTMSGQGSALVKVAA